MIFDRTALDVSSAKSIRNLKLKNNIALTDADKLQLERGMLTCDTLNRIEAKEAEVAKLLTQNGYDIEITTNTGWARGDDFTESDMTRILDNLRLILQTYTTTTSPDDVPNTMLGYNELNIVEKTLYDIPFIIDDMRSAFIYASDEYYTGEIV